MGKKSDQNNLKQAFRGKINEEYYNRFEKQVYFHPYFTYHIKATHYYNTGNHHIEYYFDRYSIPKYTLDWNESSIFPSDIDERSVQNGFCWYIQQHTVEEIPNFLDYQFEEYSQKTKNESDQVAFLEYIILTIEGFNDWKAQDFKKLNAVGKWLRANQSFQESFNQRLWNWLGLNPDFLNIYQDQIQLTKPQSLGSMTTNLTVNSTGPLQAEKELLARAKKYVEIIGKIPSQAVLALFYYFLQEAKIEPWFRDFAPRKVALMHAVAPIYGFDGKNFEMYYNDIFSSNNGRKSKVLNSRNLNKLMPYLKGFPEAQSKAEMVLTTMKIL